MIRLRWSGSGLFTRASGAKNPMNRRRFLIAGSSILPLAACAHRAATSDDFETEIPGLMAEFSVPGVSVAVIHDAKIVWARGFGLKSVATREPMNVETIFEAGSMSKPVFAYVALKLCEKGVIGLDQPLAKFAPEPFIKGDPKIGLVTPRHILSHSSGLPNWRSGKEPLRINFTPGTQYRYSGEGYYYLQSVITHLKGKVDRSDCAKFEADFEVCASDIDDFLRRTLLEPFGMKSSGYGLEEKIQKLKASPHGGKGQALPQGKPSRTGMTRYASAGALHCTPTDFAKFMIEILNPKPADEFRLTRSTLEEMIRPHVKVVNGEWVSAWGLGWQIQSNGLINHGGDNAGFHCHAIASPKAKSGFVVMTNGDGGPGLIQKLFQRPALDLFFGIEAREAKP